MIKSYEVLVEVTAALAPSAMIYSASSQFNLETIPTWPIYMYTYVDNNTVPKFIYDAIPVSIHTMPV